MIRGIIFDLDGTLITSEDVIEDALHRVVRELTGQAADSAAFRAARVQMGSNAEQDAFRIFCDVLGLDATPERVQEMYTRYQEQGFPRIRLTEGTERLVRHMHAHGIPMAIATNTVRAKVILKTTSVREVMDLIPHVVTLDDVLFGKPHPAMVKKAAKLLKQAPASCLMFDDNPKGIVAAMRAGAPSIGLTFRITPEEMPGADAYLPSLAHFKPNEWGLPPFGDE